MTAEKPRGQMAHIPPSSLRSLPTRISYLSSFLSFAPSDGLAIQASKPFIAPLIPTALDLVYTKLLSYDITAKAFVPRQTKSPAPHPTRAQDLHLTHEHILRRKDFLKNYLIRIVSNKDWTPSSPLWDYLDKVGVAHTGGGARGRGASQKPPLRVEVMHMGLLLGFVEDVIVALVLETEGLDPSAQKDVIRAWNKLLWIQNDLFARHYVVDEDTGELPRGGRSSERKGVVSALAVGALGMLIGIASSVGYATWA